MINYKAILNIIVILFYSYAYCMDKPQHTSNQIIESFYNQMEAKGYIEFENQDFGKEFYEELYKSYEKFLDLVQGNSEVRAELEKAEKEFTNDNIERFEATGYKDNSNLKSEYYPYFKFVKEYLAFLDTKYPHLMEYSDLKIFLEKISIVNEKTQQISAQIINLLEEKYQGISKYFYDKQERLYTVTKIIKSKHRDTVDMSRKGHYDRSAFTVLWDSNEEKYDSLVVSEDINNPSVDKLTLPTRLYPRSNDHTSGLIISGAACNAIDLPIKPLLHNVLPFNQKCRYSLVSFLVPNITYTMPEIKKD